MACSSTSQSRQAKLGFKVKGINPPLLDRSLEIAVTPITEVKTVQRKFCVVVQAAVMGHVQGRLVLHLSCFQRCPMWPAIAH